MPLKDRDRTRPRRLTRLGVIRLGHKVTKTKKRQDGSTYDIEYPVQDDHFVFTDAPDLAEKYGDACQELNVILPFPDIARNFDAYYQVWAGGTLVCKGDGDCVQYAAPFKVAEKEKGGVSVHRGKGDTLVSDGVAQVAFSWNGMSFEPGEIVTCPGEAQDLYPHCAACQLGGVLKVMMADADMFRFGYYQVATGSGRNYDSILGTLELISGNGQRPVNGFPFKLRLVEEATQYIENGERKPTVKWFIKLEPDPELTRRLYSAQVAQTFGAVLGIPANVPTPPAGDNGGEYIDESPDIPPPWAEEGGPAEGDDELVDAAEEMGAEVIGKDEPWETVNSPAGLLRWVNGMRGDDGYGDNIYRLLNAVKKELGAESYSWPAANDAEGWKAAQKAAMDHVHGGA